jgi:limonene-1,2-epoxide hydrolase
MQTNARELVRRFCVEWPGLAPAAMREFFTPDFTYRHVSLDRPIVGAAALAGAIEVFRARFEQIDTEIKAIAEAEETVLCERLEHFWLPGGKRIVMPALASVGIRDRRIVRWLEFFDLAGLKRQVDLTEA